MLVSPEIVSLIFITQIQETENRSHDENKTLLCIYFVQCIGCDDLGTRLDILETLVQEQTALVHKQTDVIRRQETKLANQADDMRRLQSEMVKQANVIKRLIPLETEIAYLKGMSQRIDKRIVLGMYVCYIFVFSEITKSF